MKSTTQTTDGHDMTNLQNKIFDAIVPVYQNASFTFDDIRNAIETANVKIPAKGWMNVRNVMTAVNKMNGFARTNDVHTETFARA